jgi:hypothetical protein
MPKKVIRTKYKPEYPHMQYTETEPQQGALAAPPPPGEKGERA